MANQKAERNKTIDTPLSEGAIYLNRCVTVTEKQNSLINVLDKTILGDTFSVCSFLPPDSVDLIIADPPYNLTKSFNGTTFSKKKDSDYEEYTRQWLRAVKPLLKDTGSIYVCCDWETSLIIGKVLGEFFCVRNRITWQREKGRGAKKNWKNGMEDIWFATNSNNFTFNLDAVKIRKRLLRLIVLTESQKIGWSLKAEIIEILVRQIFGMTSLFRFGPWQKTQLIPHRNQKS